MRSKVPQTPREAQIAVCGRHMTSALRRLFPPMLTSPVFRRRDVYLRHDPSVVREFRHFAIIAGEGQRNGDGLVALADADDSERSDLVARWCTDRGTLSLLRTNGFHLKVPAVSQFGQRMCLIDRDGREWSGSESDSSAHVDTRIQLEGIDAIGATCAARGARAVGSMVPARTTRAAWTDLLNATLDYPNPEIRAVTAMLAGCVGAGATGPRIREAIGRIQATTWGAHHFAVIAALTPESARRQWFAPEDLASSLQHPDPIMRQFVVTILPALTAETTLMPPRDAASARAIR